MAIQARAIRLLRHLMKAVGVLRGLVKVLQNARVMARPAPRRVVLQHLVLGGLMIVRVVADATGRIAVDDLLHTVNALLLRLVTDGADTRLLLLKQHLILPGQKIVTGDAGEVIEHMQGMLPVAGGILLVAGQALRILRCGRCSPARAKAYIRRDLGGCCGVVGAGAMAVRAAMAACHGLVVPGKAMGACQQRVDFRIRAEVVAAQTGSGISGGSLTIIQSVAAGGGGK